MNPADTRKRLFTIIGIVAAVLITVFLIIFLIVQQQNKNQFGEGVRIQNFDQKVDHSSKELRDGIEAYLLSILEKNTPEGSDLKGIKDAYIRNESESEDYDDKAKVYTGKFIVDIESLKQSYLVDYRYITEYADESPETAGDTVIMTCLPKEDLIYGAFKCFDFVSQQTSEHEDIIRNLPYENFSFRLTADATEGNENLVLNANLRIPESDLTGDIASKRSVVEMYKNEVIQWIISKDVDPTKYTINYNYTDDGDLK